eukprot:NODE_8_length_66115_cov_0.981823.p36 type:complete len:217 gc:universal NODE_8_length_66115_cov_0.981823:12265-12915(+)
MEIHISSQNASGWHTFSPNMLISEFQHRLELITGIRAVNQTIVTDSRQLAIEQNLGVISDIFKSNQQILVKGAVEFDENVEKYEISDEHYSKLNGTVQSFLKENKLGKYKEGQEVENVKDFSEFQLNCRCFVEGLEKYGTIRYLGTFHLKPNKIFVGIEYDEPVGKHNGTVDKKTYFTCAEKHGALLRPSSVLLEMPNGSKIPSANELFERELEEM